MGSKENTDILTIKQPHHTDVKSHQSGWKIGFQGLLTVLAAGNLFFSMRVTNTALDSASDGEERRNWKVQNDSKKKKNVEEGRFSATNVSGSAQAGLELGHIRSATTPRVLCTQLLMQRTERAAIRCSSIFHMRSIRSIHSRLTRRVALVERAVTVARLTVGKSCTRQKHSSLLPLKRLIFFFLPR